MLFYFFSNLFIEGGFSKFLENGKTSLDASNILLVALYGLDENYWFPLQVAMFSATAVIIGLITWQIIGSHRVYAALLATLTPTLFLWTASETGESVLLLFCSFGLLFLIRFLLKGGKGNGLVAGVFFGLSLLTRGTLVAWPFVGFCSLFVIFFFVRRVGFRTSLFLSFIPFLFCFLVILGVSGINYRDSGKAYWSKEGGEHLIYWVYPCLASAYGCGTRDLEALNKAKASVMNASSKIQISNDSRRGDQNALMKRVAYDHIRELGVQQITASAMYSLIRQVIYTPVRNWFGRMGIPQGSALNILVNKRKDYQYKIGAVIGITLIELINVCLRGIQVFGLIVLMRQPKKREIAILIIGYVVAALATGIAIGNPRYRAATEVVLIPLLVIGASSIYELVKKRQPLFFRGRIDEIG
jgi:hypothetical protein